MKKFLLPILFSALCANSVLSNPAGADVSNREIFFFDAPAEGVYDPSWTTVTPPSQLPGSDGKLVAVSDIKQSGENSLRLNWMSATDGSWAACIASEGWAEHDLSRMSEIRFWLYATNAIANNALPLVYFQNTKYALTGKVKMGKYVTGDLKAGQWIEIGIPVSDLVKDTPDYDLSCTKSLFFEQDLADGTEHSLYIDNIVLVVDPNYQPPTELSLFKDSSDETFYDQSWVNVTAPSIVEQAADHNEKLIVDTAVKHEGNNSLRLTYKSATGGNWMALVASIGWLSFDLTTTDYEIRFWVCSSADISGDALPQLYFEASTGGTCGKLKMGDYVTVLKANEWTEVIIPISKFREADPTFAKWNGIKGLFFLQNNEDNTTHTLYLDDMRFVKEGTGTSIRETQSESAAVSVYYKDGAIYYENLEGTAHIYNLLGTKQLQINPGSKNGSFVSSLAAGIYILTSDTNGSCKFIVR